MTKQKVLLLCEVCRNKIVFKARTVEEMVLETAWHKQSGCRKR